MRKEEKWIKNQQVKSTQGTENEKYYVLGLAQMYVPCNVAEMLMLMDAGGNKTERQCSYAQTELKL